MIRINLLPVREAKRQAGLRKQAIFVGMAAGVGVLLSALLGLSVAARTSAKATQIRAATEELSKLEKTRDEVEKYRKEKEDIERKLGVIASLERTRTGQVRILDDIATRIPERVWLEELTLKDGVIFLSGVSIDAEVAAEFTTALSSSEQLREIELRQSVLQEKDGLKLTTFQIEGRYGPEQPKPSEKPTRTPTRPAAAK